MDPLISIIIPSYNQGGFISQTIESILTQSYQNIEVLVIDGGSSDQTLEILKSYGDRIFWLSEIDRGQTHAINKGLALAKGQIIAYLNSDDYYLDGTLEKVVLAFSTNKEDAWITGDYIIVDESGNKMQSAIARYKTFFRKRISFNVLTVLNPVIQPSTFLSKSLIDKVGMFNEELRYTMDYEYWLRAIRIRKPVILHDELSAFRIHKSSKGGSEFRNQFNEELKVGRRYQKNPFFNILHSFHNLFIGLVYSIIK
jgi:glycosyltransferase involved in cell wall biosynthesis